MKKCELCNSPARTYCESDEAHLCWTCDAKVHGANFLVARHARTLLCRNCQSVTPWKASGPKLGRTVSVCDPCATERNFKQQPQQHDESEADNEDFTTADHDLAGNGENQVVPWSVPPAATSSSSSSSFTSNQEHVPAKGMKSVKRTRESSCSTDLKTPFKNDINHSSSQKLCCRGRGRSEITSARGGDGDTISVDSSSLFKKQQTHHTDTSIPVKRDSRSTVIIKSETVDDKSTIGGSL